MANTISEGLNKSATAILTVIGLMAIPFQVAEWLDSPMAGAITGAGVMLLLGVPAARYLLPSKVQRRFGVRRYKAPPIVVSSIEHVLIRADFTATIDTTQTLIFTEMPASDDLVDIIDVLPANTIDESSYSTPDSDITDIVRKTPSTLAIRWRPRVSIIPFVPHVHQTSYTTPPVYGDDAFYQAMYVDRDTGLKDWDFEVERPVEKAITFVMPRLGARVTEEYLYPRFVRGDTRGCEQPTLDSDGHHIRWTLKHPEKGRTYVLFAVYRGMSTEVIAKGREYQTLSYRLRSIRSKAAGALMPARPAAP